MTTGTREVLFDRLSAAKIAGPAAGQWVVVDVLDSQSSGGFTAITFRCGGKLYSAQRDDCYEAAGGFNVVC
jgi:hypothetical protein